MSREISINASNSTSIFSSNAEAAITRSIDLDEQHTRTGLQIRPTDAGGAFSSIEEFYEIDRTASQIKEHNFKRIALQFPDEMLCDSVPIYLALNARLNQFGYNGCQLFVLADTSYGSCCVDEVAAQHVNADLVIHYGHACLSPTSRLPTIYVYGKRPIDTEKAVDSIVSILPSVRQISLRTDVSFDHATDLISASIRHKIPNSTVLASRRPLFQLPRTSTSTSDHPTLVLETGQKVDSKDERDENGTESVDDVIVFIGPETLALSNILMTNNNKNIYRYDPSSHECIYESPRTNKLLMRRYTMMQRARDADVFGILVGTLGVASYLHLIIHLRKILGNAGKKAYTVCVGKLNPAKLANFAEIECFVLVACPENSIVESKEFFRPIVTPFELELALGVIPDWDGRYLLDFDKVVKEATAGEGEEMGLKAEKDDEQDGPEFSLITGKYRHVKQYGKKTSREENEENKEKNALVPRNQEGTVARVLDSAAGDFMSSRTWKGLEQRSGQDAPSLLEQGRSGIARGYETVDHP